jgi:hypothetical protein
LGGWRSSGYLTAIDLPEIVKRMKGHELLEGDFKITGGPHLPDSLTG